MSAFEPNPRAVIGGNQPNFTADALADARSRLATFARRKRDLLRSAAKVTIRDRVDAGSAADLIGIARDVRNLVDTERKAVIDPHSEAVKAVNARVRDFWDRVDDAMRVVQGRLDEFAREEKKRIAAQEAEQQAEMQRRREALQPAAALPHPPPPPPVGTQAQPKRRSFRGDYGRQAIVQDVAVISVSNWRELPEWVFTAPDVLEAIRKTVAPLVKKKVTIPGITVGEDIKTSVRK